MQIFFAYIRNYYYLCSDFLFGFCPKTKDYLFGFCPKMKDYLFGFCPIGTIKR